LPAFFVWLLSRNILLTKDLDYNVRTDNGTGGTACAIGVGCLGGEIAAFIGLPGYDDAALRTN
jgi:hypothetical protein